MSWLRSLPALAGIIVMVGAAPGARAQVPQPYTYVALGDSFSAGEGIDPYFRDGYDPRVGRQTGHKNNRCHRSTRAYAEQIRPRGFSKPLYQVASSGDAGTGKRIDKYASDANVRVKDGVTWAFLACSGARTSNVTPAHDGGTPWHEDHVPQLDDPAIGSATSLVTLTIGGNDVGFADTIGHCATHACNTPAYRALLDRRLSGASAKLDAVYSALAAKAANARIVVLGYPQLFPHTAQEQGCGKLRPWRGEATMLRGKETAFNSLIKQKATAAGFEFVDVAARFARHEICGNAGEWINGPSLSYKPNRKFIDDESFHPNRNGQADMAAAVNALLERPPPPATEVTRQAPVTADAQIAAGFRVVDTTQGERCGEGSDIGVAYRCFAGNGVFDPCYAVGEPGTGDATSVVCPRSPFTTDLLAIENVKGLGRLEDSAFDEPNGIVLSSGAQCIAAQGAHDNDGAGHVVDFGCDDGRTAVLRGLHKGRIWRANVVTYDSDYKYTQAGVVAVRRVVLLQHDVPPANRPVTDAQDATTDELDAEDRVHHEVDCGTESTTSGGRVSEQTFTSGAPCYESTLVVTEWDNDGALEPGWSCTYSDGGTLLCQKSDRVAADDPPAFFAAPHLRAVRR
ncbi:MAG TPA: SGNH/GDSL hydrolase family protein [Solirubrobacteraceae bacterium]|jgi:lysophospholipase L1-like esterase